MGEIISLDNLIALLRLQLGMKFLTKYIIKHRWLWWLLD